MIDTRSACLLLWTVFVSCCHLIIPVLSISHFTRLQKKGYLFLVTSALTARGMNPNNLTSGGNGKGSFKKRRLQVATTALPNLMGTSHWRQHNEGGGGWKRGCNIRVRKVRGVANWRVVKSRERRSCKARGRRGCDLAEQNRFRRFRRFSDFLLQLSSLNAQFHKPFSYLLRLTERGQLWDLRTNFYYGNTP